MTARGVVEEFAMDAFFKELGRTVLERWKRENFSLEKFPGISCAALEKRPPSQHVDLPALMREFLLEDEQAFQTTSGFGQPELVAYDHPRFYIQLLFWMEGTTAIHQHEFSGAFHVLHGSSIHADYKFQNARSVTPHLRVGDLKMRGIELLETGRTVPIVSGRQSIHSLFHLDTPSITVVVRTQHDPGTGPQFNYLPPHVALDPEHTDALTMRRQQLLDVLEEIEDATYPKLVRKMIAELDFERGFHVLQHCMGALQNLDEWERALAIFQKKHGALAAGIAATLEEEVRRNVIKGMRGSIAEPEHRFFLALLMNAPTRADLLALVAQRFPEAAPVETVLRWADELAELSDFGFTILDASMPGVASEAQAELFITALGHFLRGGKKMPSALRTLPVATLPEWRAVFAESSLRVLVA